MDMVDGENPVRCGKDDSGKTYEHECDACKYDERVSEAKCCEEFATTRSEVKSLSNELERDLYKDLDRREASDTAAISENLHVIAHTITHLTTTLKGAQDAVDVNDDAVFIAINKSDQLISEGETIVADIQQDASTSTFTFKPDDAVSELTKPKQLGEIVADTIKVSESQQLSGKSLNDIEVASFAEHNVKTKGQNVTRMTSATAVGDGWSVICYTDNCKLKLLDSNQKCIDTITLRSPPYDVAADEASVIVTLPEENKLQYVDVGQKLSIARAIQMGSKCYGVSVSEYDIVVSCVHERSRKLEVHVLNKLGKSVKRISVPVDTSPSPVWWPAYVAVNEEGNKIYVSDPVTSTIYSLTYHGDLVNTYRDVDPIRPWMITVEGEDTLVCVAGRITVHKAAKLTKK